MNPAIGWTILIVIFIIGFYCLAKFEGKWEELKEGKRIDIVWPKITSKSIAIVVGYRCAFITIIFGGISIMSGILIATLDKTDINILRLADGITMCIIGYGIYKMSRVAAFLGLITCILNRIHLFINGGYIVSIITFIVYGLIYINAIRATMIYHKNILILGNIKNKSA